MAWRATGLAAALVTAAAAGVDLADARTAANTALALDTRVEMIRAHETPDGDMRIELVPLAEPAPGLEVVYSVTFTNVGSRTLHDVRISTAIPARLRYAEGTASAPGARVFYSVDGGDRFAPPQELVVADTADTTADTTADATADAADAERPARAADYTHIRWLLTSALEPGASGTARFRAVMLDSV